MPMQHIAATRSDHLGLVVSEPISARHDVHRAVVLCTPHGMPRNALQTAGSSRRRPQFTINAQRPHAAMTP
jgi:hypothetical protein